MADKWGTVVATVGSGLTAWKAAEWGQEPAVVGALAFAGGALSWALYLLFTALGED